jgi:hypothetical protein
VAEIRQTVIAVLVIGGGIRLPVADQYNSPMAASVATVQGGDAAGGERAQGLRAGRVTRRIGRMIAAAAMPTIAPMATRITGLPTVGAASERSPQTIA